jgi:hypothetical protein
MGDSLMMAMGYSPKAVNNQAIKINFAGWKNHG